MNINLFSNQPLISNSLADIIKKGSPNGSHCIFYAFETLNNNVDSNDIIVILESKINPLSYDNLRTLHKVTTKILFIKNPFSSLNTQSLYEIGIQNIITTEDSEVIFQNCLNAVKQNTPFLSPSILKEINLINLSQKHNLSDTEIKIIKMSWAEKRNQEIADFLCLSIRTIENKRVKIKEKYAVNSFTGVFKKAIKDGLIQI